MRAMPEETDKSYFHVKSNLFTFKTEEHQSDVNRPRSIIEERFFIDYVRLLMTEIIALKMKFQDLLNFSG